MNGEKQELFNSICEGLGIAPPTQGQMDDFISALGRNGLRLTEKCCEPFQPCEKCKTEWENIQNDVPRDKDYWWMDSNNKTAIGKVLKNGSFSFLDSHQDKNFNWNLVVMFAEIKPPPVP